MNGINEILLPVILNMKIHDKIRTIRQSENYTQEYIAEKLGIDTVNYGRMERGKAKLTVDRLLEICTILNIEPGILFQNTLREETETTILCEKIYKEVKEINKKI